MFCFVFFFFKQKTAYEMRISDWSSDVCSSDLLDLQDALTIQPVLRLAHQAGADAAVLPVGIDRHGVEPAAVAVVAAADAAGHRAGTLGQEDLGIGAALPQRDVARRVVVPDGEAAALPQRRAGGKVVVGVRPDDRKSTRLNSSH